MPEDPVLALFRFLTDLTARHGDMFEAQAMALWLTFTKIAYILFFCMAALPGVGWRWDKFAKLTATVVMTQLLIQFYSAPMPVVGTSFSAMILNWGQELANVLNAKMYDLVVLRLDTLWLSLQSPSFYSILSLPVTAAWGIIASAILIAKFCVTFSITFGFIAVTVMLLVGPVFVCFLALPGFQWMFHNWFRATLQFAFYGVFANAMVFVLGSMLIGFVDTAGTKLTGLQMIASLPALVQYLFIFASGVLVMPPILTSACFSGHTGQVQIGIGR